MKLLALDTTESACSAALLIDGGATQRFRDEPRAHGRLILGMIDELLGEAGLSPTQLDGIAFGRGPGSFTGLRIAAGVTQGIAFGADLPVSPISSLRALAQGVHRERGASRVFVALDARMREIYCGAFGLEKGVMRALDQEKVIQPKRLHVDTRAESGWVGAGSGWRAYPEVLSNSFDSVLPFPDAVCHAIDVGACALADLRGGIAPLPAEQAVPVYLRDRVATPKL